ncbi:MAG: LysR family transcriptional regulator [Spirosoma sp.]|nr:LysR family transcriptional regulator [Spirosoma sp.]
MATDIGWELYRTFLGVLREGSLSGAARALGITQPTVGRHIGAFERALRVPLFTRSQTGLLPTEAALALRAYAETMDSTAAALRRVAESQGTGVKGTVRISASEIVGAEVLPPIIADLRQEYPDLQVELVLTNRIQDLVRQVADIAVRMTQPKQDVLMARHVGDVLIGLHARRDYLERHGTPKTIAELASHTLIGYDQETAFIRATLKLVPPMARAAFALRSDSDTAQLALIRAGCGIGLCQVGVAKRSPELVRLLPRQVALKLNMWVTMHGDLRSSRRCRVTFDSLVAGLLRYVA